MGIGQRKDGTFIFVVVDGRQPGYSIGTNLLEMQNIFNRYDAYNAANLDGGSSATMYYNGKVVVVTGAGGVLCSVIAKAYAKEGAKVALLDLNLEAAEAKAAAEAEKLRLKEEAAAEKQRIKEAEAAEKQRLKEIEAAEKQRLREEEAKKKAEEKEKAAKERKVKSAVKSVASSATGTIGRELGKNVTTEGI